jgi:Flp pilus assembly protein TadD
MTFGHVRNTLRLGLALLAAGVACSPASTQSTAFSGGYRESAGTSLNRHLKTLADSPRDLSALTGAAKAALELGDPQAAVTFYARAEEIAPRDGRIKAGIAAAFLAMEQPASAFRFLEEARGLGVPDGEIAADRGLAHDLLGDPVQAQRDYLIAQRTHDTDELRRRLALSRAITGDRGGALAAIQDQLARKDRAAWRVRAFVLALTGDYNGATDAARAMLPAQAAAMQPFFQRLPSLRPADKAMAVHFGRFPGDGTPGQSFQSPPTYAGLSPNVTAAGRPDAGQAGVGRTTPPYGGGAPPQSGAGGASTGPDRTFSQPVASRPTTPQPTQTLRSTPAITAQPVRVAEAQVPKRTPPRPQTPRETEYSLSAWEIARGYTRPRRSANTLNGNASAQTRPAPAPSQATTSGNITTGAGTAAQRNERPTRMAVNNAAPVPFSNPIANAPVQLPVVPVAPPGAQFSGLAPARIGPVQGPSDGGLRPVAVSPPPPATPVAPSAAATVAPGLSTVMQGATASASPPSIAQAAPSSPAAPIVPSAPSTASVADAPPVVPNTPASVTAPAATGLAALAATIRQLPDAEPESSTKSSPAVKKPDLAKADPVKPKKAVAEKPEPAKPREPSRHWVQVAGTADKAGLNREYARIKAKAPKLFTGKTAWTTPLRFTNRLLVGPFKDDGEAQEFVNELAKADLSAFTWTSPAGQEIERLASGSRGS